MTFDVDKFKGISMPVFPWDYQGLPIFEHWFYMANAYLSCCQHLLSEMADERFERNFFRAKVCVALYDQAIELFFKGAITLVDEKVITSHNLSELHKRYKDLYPEKEFLFEVDIANVVKKNDYWVYNEFARYPVDKDGNPWQGNTHIDIVLWLKNIILTQKDFSRLEPLLLQKYTK